MKKAYPLLALLCFSPVTLAADIADEVRRGSSGYEPYNGGYVEVSAFTSCVNSAKIDDLNDTNTSDCGVGFGLGGEYRYNGLFFEASANTRDGLNIGYTLWSNANWSIDLLAASVSGRYTLKDDYTDPEDPDLTEQQRNQAIIDRNTFFSGAGTRITYFFGENIFQFRLVHDVYDGNGIQSTARVGRAWQVRNWNFHAIASLIYSSARLNRNHNGINEKEATARFAPYRPGASVETALEVGATFPLGENWVSRTTLFYTPHSSTLRNSPLYNDSWSGVVSTSIAYVF